MTSLLLLPLLLLSRFSHVRLCATPQTAAHQAPPSLGFSGVIQFLRVGGGRKTHFSTCLFEHFDVHILIEIASQCAVYFVVSINNMFHVPFNVGKYASRTKTLLSKSDTKDSVQTHLFHIFINKTLMFSVKSFKNCLFGGYLSKQTNILEILRSLNMASSLINM